MKDFSKWSLLLVLVISCAEMNQNLESDWSESMSGMAEAYNDLIPFLYDNGKFRTPFYSKEILKSLDSLVAQSESIKKHQNRKMLGMDPIFQLTLSELKHTNSRAREDFKAGKYDNAQYLLKNSILFCSQCHSHSRRGPEILAWDNFAEISKVPPIERSRIYTATRQYEKAIGSLEDFLSSSPLPPDRLVREAVKSLINIAVIQRSDLQIAINKIERIQKDRHHSKLTSSTQLVLEKWKQQLIDWKVKKSKGQLVRTEDLIKRKDSHLLSDDSGYVLGLQKSLIYHDSLRASGRIKNKSEIYYKLGLIYDQYPDMSVWKLPEAYFQACIFLRPHTGIAKKCYKSLERRIRSIYRFNGIAAIPLSEKDRLNHYKSLSDKAPRKGAPGANFYNH